MLLPPFVADAAEGLGSVAPRQSLKLIKQREGNVIRLLVENLESAHVTGTFDLRLENLKTTTRFPFTCTFPPRRTVEVFRLSPLRTDQPWHYTVTNFYMLGSHLAVHDDAFVYQLPYDGGRTFRVSQAYHGAFSHSGHERYAIDWAMPVGTPVRAARGGLVVAVRADSKRGGPDRSFEDAANYILIEHSDGTIGNYAHLMPNGATVKVGQKVETGERIGFSGTTGFSNGPHLHFCVFKTKNGKERESIPIRFLTEAGPLTLLSGEAYQAPKALPTRRASR